MGPGEPKKFYEMKPGDIGRGKPMPKWPKYNKYPDEFARKVIEAASVSSDREAGRQFGISPSTVTRMRERLGGPMPMFRQKGMKLNEEKVREILRRRPEKISQGPLAREIASEFGVSEATVVKVWLRRTWAHVKLEDSDDSTAEGHAGSDSRDRRSADCG